MVEFERKHSRIDRELHGSEAAATKRMRIFANIYLTTTSIDVDYFIYDLDGN